MMIVNWNKSMTSKSKFYNNNEVLSRIKEFKKNWYVKTIQIYQMDDEFSVFYFIIFEELKPNCVFTFVI